MFSKIDGIIAKITEFLMVSTLLVAIIFTLIQVVLRYFLHISLPWSQEFIMMCFIYSIFSGAAYLAFNSEHLVVDLFDDLSEKLEKILIIIESIVVIAVSFVFVYFGIDLVIKNFESAQTLATLPIKETWLYLSVPISSSIIIYFYIRKLVKLCRG